jgi:hypothetical protein
VVLRPRAEIGVGGVIVGPAPELQPLGDDALEHVGGIWLHQRHRAAIGQRLDGARVTRTKNDGQAWPQLVQPFGKLQAVDVRHHDVRKHEVHVGTFLDSLQRFPGRHDQRNVAPECFQQLAGCFRAVVVVVDDKYARALGD